MLVRGFKTKCENISVEIRKKLGLGKIDPLSPEALAEYLGVRLLKPTDIENLSDKSRIQLLYKDKDSWSAVTISYLGVDLIAYNPTHSKWRHSSDIMHELSHIILGHKPSQIVYAFKEILTNRDKVKKVINIGLNQANKFDWKRTSKNFLSSIKN